MAAEWDLAAEARAGQIASGLDYSYEHVLLPSIESLAGPAHGVALDIGCGTGDLTRRLATKFTEVVGIDISHRSISLARELTPASSLRLSFYPGHVSDLIPVYAGRFNLVIANMVLMNAPNLADILESISKLGTLDMEFIFSITHPTFWPRYWGYEDAEWFDYYSELFIETDFRTTMLPSSFRTTHIHRPLSAYSAALQRAGLGIEVIVEPSRLSQNDPGLGTERVFVHHDDRGCTGGGRLDENDVRIAPVA